MTTEVKLIGAPEAMADLRRWTDQVAPAVNKAAEPFAQRVADTVENRVPHLTGTLASSIEVTAEDEAIAVGYDGTVPYDGWIEFGGSHGRSYVSEGRYLFPTATASEDDFVQVASDAATDSVSRFSWSTPTA